MMKLNKLKQYLFTGTLIVVPFIITISIFIWLFHLIDGIFGRFINKFLMYEFGFFIPGLGIIFGIAVIFFAGFFATHLISKSALAFFERQFTKFPIIKQVYPAAKQIIAFVFTDARSTFKKTILVEYPRKGVYTLAFLTNDGAKYFSEKVGHELVNVFIPSTPGPLTGFMVMVPKQDVIMIDISVEDALKMLISGGVINPS